MTFDEYWKKCGVATSPAAMGLAFRETAEKAWNAANSAENAKLLEENARLLRGEYICRACGLRKDGDKDPSLPAF